MSEQNQNNDQQLNSTESQGIPSVVGKKTNKSTKKAGFMLLLIALLLGAGFCLFAINKEDKGDIATTDVNAVITLMTFLNILSLCGFIQGNP